MTTRRIDRLINAIHPSTQWPLHSVVRLTPDAIEMHTPGVLTEHYDRSAVRFIVENADDLIVLALGRHFAIPKHVVAADTLKAFRECLTEWAYPQPILRQPPRVGMWSRVAVACFVGALLFGAARYLSLTDPDGSSIDAPISIAMPLANQVLSLPPGLVTLSNLSFRILKRPDGTAQLLLSGAVLAPNLRGWADIQAYPNGFSTLSAREDLGNPSAPFGRLPPDAVLTDLPDHGAQATWVKAGERCAAMRQYGERVPNTDRTPLYRRNILLFACSPTLSHEDLLAWERGAAPVLIGRAG